MAKKGQAKGRSRRREKEGRPERWKAYKQYFLIVCEDEVTEPTYFEKFRTLFPENTLFLRTIGTGNDPLGVIQTAIQKRNELSEKSSREIDFTWVVFDKDDADLNKSKLKRFEEALQIANLENIHIALSNEVFEVWLLLHFTIPSFDHPIPRNMIYSMLENEIKTFEPDFIYNHGKKEIINLVQMYGNEGLAIANAKILREFHVDKSPIERNPSTDIFILVEELRSWIEFYSK
jgi:hypothetical protein